MKKFFLFAAAMLAAVSVNARVITLDLSTATEMAYTGCSATPSFSDGVLNVNYSAGAWEWAGVEIALDNLEVTSIDFDYKGETAEWCSFVVYLRASDGARWYDDADDFSMSHADWLVKTGYFPTKLMWDASESAIGDLPFTAIGFIANPMNATNGTFAIRNVKLTVPGDDTGIEDVNASVKAIKMVRNGQLIIVRDGKTFNAIGAEMK
jgi:hypothetical protein